MSTAESRRRHQFLETARSFRAGKISLSEFADQFFPLPGSESLEPTMAGEAAGQTPFRRLPPRPADCHKGTFGHVLVVAGSLAMPGAAALCGLAALRAGAGLVTIATPRQAQAIVASFHPCIMTAGLPDDAGGHLTSEALPAIAALAERATCLAIGPGLGQTVEVRRVVRELIQSIPLPLIVDADGLNAIASDETLPVPGGPRIYTPHPGELQRLVRTRPTNRAAQERAAAAWIAALPSTFPQILLLKGHQSFLTDGRRQHHNHSGSPALATAGSGDVLTGVIAALLAQRLPGWDAAALGAHVHGYAGELAATAIGSVGVVATDILERLPAALSARGLDGSPPTALP